MSACVGRPPARSRARRWAWDLITGAVVLAAGLMPFVEHDDRPGGPDVAIDQPLALILPAVIAALVLPLRRRWPLAVLAGMIALLGVGGVLVGSTLPFVVPVAIAAFAFARRTERRRSVVVMAVVLVVLVGLELLAGQAGLLDPRLIAVPAVVGFAAAAGDGARSRRAYIDEITDRAERAERTKESEARRRVAEERLRIARDLHDAVAHQIAVINLHSGVAARAIADDPPANLPAARTSLATIGGAAREVLAEIGDLLSVLRSDGADAESPGTDPVPGLADLDRLIAGFESSGLHTTLRIEGTRAELPAAVDHVAHRVIREGLTNAHKHGSGHRAHVLLEYGAEALEITVTNPIEIAADAPADASTGLGLVGIRERVASVRGTVDAGPAGSVFRLAARLPFERDSGPRHPPAEPNGTAGSA